MIDCGWKQHARWFNQSDLFYEDDERGDAGAIDRDAADRGIFRACSSQEESSIQSGSKDSLRRDSCNGARQEGSQDVQRMLALQGSTRRSLGQQPLWKMAGVSEVRSEVELCAGQGRASPDHTGQLGAECPGGTSSSSHGRPRGGHLTFRKGHVFHHPKKVTKNCQVLNIRKYSWSMLNFNFKLSNGLDFPFPAMIQPQKRI